VASVASVAPCVRAHVINGRSVNRSDAGQESQDRIEAVCELLMGSAEVVWCAPWRRCSRQLALLHMWTQGGETRAVQKVAGKWRRCLREGAAGKVASCQGDLERGGCQTMKSVWRSPRTSSSQWRVRRCRACLRAQSPSAGKQGRAATMTATFHTITAKSVFHTSEAQ
jgi:hypothetical protein